MATFRGGCWERACVKPHWNLGGVLSKQRHTKVMGFSILSFVRTGNQQQSPINVPVNSASVVK